eukprot:CAMPEP_0116135648 /NCGR_PEP_ID=MMETSP0329-20121206/11301_1 /TAXON_ID=697910 /ORGANISM="Pseudo-nitzschia arenysensis, Strain B593" /LENGTH=913 /DNA_ID=CAMNT_0003630459 /DNA_START=373 /DNA_END=3114 /DNA_ORIENTATION=-
MGGAISEQDFKTPDRTTAKVLSSAAGTGSHTEEKKEDALTSNCSSMNGNRPSAKLVTPPDSFSTAAANEVRFDGKNGNDKGIEAKTLCSVGSDGGDSTSSTSSPTASQRGLVSRRGGRCGSPSRRNLLPPPSTGAKPSKEAADAAAAVLEFKTFRSPERKQNENENIDNDKSLVAVKKKIAIKSEEQNIPPHQRRPQQPKSKPAKKATSNSASIPPKKSNVSFSPVPTPKMNGDKFMKTPTKSPTGGRFTSLPTLDDDALGSPGAIFLSPTRTPTYFDRKGTSMTSRDKSCLESVSGISITGNPARSPLTPRTPKRDLDRDRLLSTPTDFAFDYGKPAANGSLLESSNVLAWLQSPTTNELFSPGGLGSMLNTPRGGLTKTPNTPTFTTSFFFSDVAGLPRGGECTSPKPPAAASENEKRSANGRGNNNIICISPLASYKTKGPNSPKINYKEMFASPAERSGMASLIASRKAFRAGVQRGGNLDAVHLAERDLMEDEDLSVLLQLASTTPRPSGSVSDPAAGSAKLDGSKVFRKNGENENLPSLQLPIIGGRDSDGKGTRLTRKTHSRDHNDVSDDRVAKPMSQTSSGPAVELKPKSTTEASKKPPTTGSMHPASRSYPPMSSHYPHHESPYYPSLHPAMAHGGSMRVVVGGPPPNRGKSTSDSQRVRSYAMGPRGEYPPPYPPPPSHYSRHRGAPPPPPPHMHPHYARYPPHPAHAHGAPPRHMPPPPLYGAHPKSKSSSSSTSSTKKQLTKVVPGKAGLKRPAPTSTPKSSKKSKKQGPAKKKNRSPQLVDKEDRQKAAATIQAVNQASGGKNNKAAALAAAILRGVTMRPSGKWQAQLYFAGKSRYIGVFDTREKAALAYEIAREKLKSEKSNAEGGVMTPKRTEAAVNAARKAAFEGVNERDPRMAGK